MTVVSNKNKDIVVSLVLDSAPLIKRVNLFNMAQKFYTIPEVIAEIRDKQAREQLENSLVDIQVKVPSEEALNAVMKFAKKTGDLATLSKTDLKVIALTWMLEKEAGNLANIRTEPIKEEEKEDDDDEGWITPDNINKYHAKHYGWDKKDKSEAKTYDVACMTADFAMQNVLLQMNLRILSVDGMIIKRLKNWVLRCHACYFSTTDMSKKFCPQCGHDTLIRTSVSIDKYGNKVYHLKKNFNYRLRGTKYSIPTYVGGQNANNIILSEDQNEYQKALKQQKFKARKEKVVDLLDPDYLNTLFTGEDSKLNSRNKGKTRKTRNDYTGDIIIGYGRRNPNERRRRRK
ncbi:hypothetical protein H8356DRAFT_1043027 [Neocallimastix lanati (nom. inval.)]|uniref:20S-pre-rRNA D-site endonuclease NOB1 n=1 Tax=Neocallimastix californiae TaxID=1754190 RepID=A0A1Y2DZM5_9FUNG|nr:hypothetical protein H8356DRAFT_1043027 [Neocallimastix sp. JGI-2020a]ORY64697.1 hypothetical protein LY90DRAFT_661117 [Neocallimastix californiae]|eukprot:ORY64697.1 hypothetical protein LY90DRAFT_661117 [Neocallimastix californiae]